MSILSTLYIQHSLCQPHSTSVINSGEVGQVFIRLNEILKLKECICTSFRIPISCVGHCSQSAVQCIVCICVSVCVFGENVGMRELWAVVLLYAFWFLSVSDMRFWNISERTMTLQGLYRAHSVPLEEILLSERRRRRDSDEAHRVYLTLVNMKIFGALNGNYILWRQLLWIWNEHIHKLNGYDFKIDWIYGYPFWKTSRAFVCSFVLAVAIEAVPASWLDTDAAHVSVQHNTRVFTEYLVFQLLSSKWHVNEDTVCLIKIRTHCIACPVLLASMRACNGWAHYIIIFGENVFKTGQTKSFTYRCIYESG